MRASLKLRIALAMRGQMQKLEQLRAAGLSRFFRLLYSVLRGFRNRLGHCVRLGLGAGRLPVTRLRSLRLCRGLRGHQLGLK